MTAIPTATIETACRVCGCTQNVCRGCIARMGHPCWWIEENLCSACAPIKDEGEHMACHVAAARFVREFTNAEATAIQALDKGKSCDIVMDQWFRLRRQLRVPVSTDGSGRYIVVAPRCFTYGDIIALHVLWELRTQALAHHTAMRGVPYV